MPDYRDRIYTHYASAWDRPLAPVTLDALEPRRALITHIIRAHFPPDLDAKILDLGCGHGAIVYFARLAGYRNISGVDLSHEQVDAARRLGIEGVEQGDLMDTLTDLPAGSHDLVLTFDVIEHFDREELLPLVDEIRRVLAPNGRWIIHVPNGESPFHGRVLHGDLTHQLAFTRASINQLLLSSGFSSVECYEDRPVAHGLKSGVRAALWLLIRSMLRVYLVVETGDSGGQSIFSQNLLAVAHR